MKRLFKPALIALSIVLLFAACKTKKEKAVEPGKDPKTLVRLFYEYASQNKYDSISDISTSTSYLAISLMRTTYNKMKEENPDHKDDNSFLTHLIIQEPVINGDLATVAVEDTSRHSKANVSVVKENGQWKIDLTKPQR